MNSSAGPRVPPGIAALFLLEAWGGVRHEVAMAEAAGTQEASPSAGGAAPAPAVRGLDGWAIALPRGLSGASVSPSESRLQTV